MFSNVYLLSFPDISPIAFSVGPVAIYWYGISYVVGILGAWMIASRKLLGTGITREQLDNVLTFAVLGIILGGRLGFVLLYEPSMLLDDPIKILDTRGGGMSFHGGLLGVLIFVGFYLYIKGISILKIADIIAIGAPVGMFFGRIANFINQEHLGKIASPDSLFAVIFPVAKDGIPRHPSQLYEAFLEGLLLLIIMLLLDYLKPNIRKKHPGFMFGLFLFWSGLSRIIVEFFRTPDGMFLGYSIGQWYSLPLVIIGMALMLYSITIINVHTNKKTKAKK